MHLRSSLLLLSLCGALAACNRGTKGDTGPKEDGADADTRSDSDTDADTDTDTEVGPCAGGAWPSVPDPGNAIHVAAGGDDGAPGTAGEPVATLAAALALTRAEGGPRAIAVGPGSFSAGLQLLGDVDGEGTTDDDMVIAGCSADETTLVAPSDDEHVLEVKGAREVQLGALTLSGGEWSLFTWDGAGLIATDIVVSESRGAGVVHSGGYFIAAGIDIEPVVPTTLTGTAQEQLGYGFAALGGEVEIEGGRILGATGAGFFGSNTTLTLRDLEVQGTAADSAGILGRGVHLQDECDAQLEALTLRDNADAGLYSLRSLSLTARELDVTGVASSDCPACSPDGTGDAVVVTRGDSTTAASAFLADLQSNSLADADRAGILLDGVTATLEGNACTGCGYTADGSSLVATATAVVTGGDAVATLDTPLPTYLTVLAEPAP